MRRIREQKAWHTLTYIILAGLMIAVAACTYAPLATAPAPEPAIPETAASPGLSGTLSGRVSYLQRIALAPDAVVEVSLQDVSKADAPAEVISTQKMETKGAQVPIAYSLKYDPSQIVERNTYAVRATITEGGKLTWTSTKRYPVLTRSAPVDNVEIIVEQVPQDSAAATPDAAALPALTGVLTGTVAYLQRIALAPDAVVEVSLQDVSKADAPAEVISTQRIETQAAQVPIAYALEYDPAKIDAKNTYAVRAIITEGEKLTWTSTKRYPVLTRGAPIDNVEIIVEQVPQDSASATSDTVTLPALTGVLTGTVAYLQRIALPPDAVIDVQLQDVSLQDAPARVIAAERYIAAGRQVPFPFELAYDPAGIDPGHTYAVAARITVDGKLRWINTQHFGVLTRGAPITGVEILVESVGGSAGMASLTELNGTVTYLQRIALPPNAIVEVSLQDVSKMDAPAEVLDSVKIPTAGRQVPIPFTLHYDPAQIDERYTYTVSARITVDGVLTWISTTQHPVLTRGAPTDNVEVSVEQVAQ